MNDSDYRERVAFPVPMSMLHTIQSAVAAEVQKVYGPSPQFEAIFQKLNLIQSDLITLKTQLQNLK